MPATTKRSRKVLPMKPRGGMTGRDGAIDFPAKAVLISQEVLHPEDHIYRVIELVGTSEESIEDAISSAVARASSTLRNLRWFEVVRTSGHITDGVVRHYQVTMKGRVHDGRHGLIVRKELPDRLPVRAHIGL